MLYDDSKINLKLIESDAIFESEIMIKVQILDFPKTNRSIFMIDIFINLLKVLHYNTSLFKGKKVNIQFTYKNLFIII